MPDQTPQLLHTMSPPLVEKPTFLGVVWAGWTIGTLALGFRYYVRVKFFHKLQLDDLLTGVAWILLLATALIWTIIMDDVYEMKYVLSGQQYPTAHFMTALGRYLHGSLAVLLMFYLGLWTIKLNFLTFFYRLGDQITYYRIYWWFVTIFTICAGITCIGTIQYECLAVSPERTSAICAGPEKTQYQNITLKVNMALDVLTDAMVMSLPISILWNVRVSLKRKFQLAGLFSLVVITIVVAIVRVSVVTNSKSVSQQNQVEVTWLYLWHFIESSVALLVACLASFRTLFAAKERRDEEREAKYRPSTNPDSGRMKAMLARAKHFQDSLFTKTHTENTKVDTEKVSDGMEFPIRTTMKSISEGSETTNHSLSTLYSNGLMESMNSKEVAGDKCHTCGRGGENIV